MLKIVDDLKSKPSPDQERKGPLLVTGLLGALGAALITLLALPALWRMTWPGGPPYGAVFTLLGAAQIVTVIAVLVHPTRQRMLLTVGAGLAVLIFWFLGRIAEVLPKPDPWIAANSVIGFTDYLVAGLEIAAVVILSAIAFIRPRTGRPRLGQALAWVAAAPLSGIILGVTVIGVLASSDAFTGAGFPADVVPPRNLPAGQVSTVEYCRPDGVPLAMDLYVPPTEALTANPAPVVLYVHGGGLWGDRKTVGLGASQANHAGALFSQLQSKLNARGFMIASIDYRLPPGTPWSAQIEDAKCAVRFLRAHAADLGIDARHIGVWGSSAGGYLSSLVGLAGPEAGFERGQYLDRSSAVQAVVDMFGVVDLKDIRGSQSFDRFILPIWPGSSSAMLHEASPITYVNSDAPPFLLLHGNEDTMVDMSQSKKLYESLTRLGVPAKLVIVKGAGHGLNTPGEQPSADELANRIVAFLEKTLNEPLEVNIP